jgi:glutathione S-transferase
MINALVTNPNVDDKTREFWTGFGSKYNYSTAGAAAAPARVAEIVTFLSGVLEQQKAKGSRFYIGDRLTALDIYSATFAGALEPLPPELCPMDSTFRDLYTEKNAVVRAAISPRLMEHRDFIYHQYLELPVVF